MHPKLLAPLRRLRYSFRRPSWISILAAIAVIGVTTAVISVRLNASPQAAGTPPMGLPSPSNSRLPQIASDTWATTAPDAVPATCKRGSLEGADGASVVSYLDDNSTQADLVAKEAKGISLIDFSWGSLASPSDIVQTDSFDPSLTTVLTKADQSSPCGLRFVTLTDNNPKLSHAGTVRMMAQILTDPSVRRQHVAAVAEVMASQPLAAGLTIDYEFGLPKSLSDLQIDEQVAGWHGLSLDAAVNRLSGDYTELIRELAIAMHQQHRLLRVAALVRDSDDVDVATTDIAPYLLDYGALAKYADQIMLEAYDFHFATGDPGPIAPFADVAKVLTYVHSYNVPYSKLAVSVPAVRLQLARGQSGQHRRVRKRPADFGHHPDGHAGGGRQQELAQGNDRKRGNRVLLYSSRTEAHNLGRRHRPRDRNGMAAADLSAHRRRRVADRQR